VNKGTREGRGCYAPTPPLLLLGRDRVEAPGARLSGQTPGVPGDALEASAGYSTLQFFGFGSPIRYPSSVVFVGMMCVA